MGGGEVIGVLVALVLCYFGNIINLCHSPAFMKK